MWDFRALRRFSLGDLFPFGGTFPLLGESPFGGKVPKGGESASNKGAFSPLGELFPLGGKVPLKGKSTKVPLGGKVPPKGKVPLIKALFPFCWGDSFPFWGAFSLSPFEGLGLSRLGGNTFPFGGNFPLWGKSATSKGKSASNKGTFSLWGDFSLLGELSPLGKLSSFGRKVPFGGTLVSPLDPFWLGFLGGLLFPFGFYSERLFRGKTLPTLGGLVLSGKLKLRLLVSFISSFISSSGREGEASWLTRPPHTLTRTIGL